MSKNRNKSIIDLECARSLRREVEKIPPQRNERAARNLARLKAAVKRLEREAKERHQ